MYVTSVESGAVASDKWFECVKSIRPVNLYGLRLLVCPAVTVVYAAAESLLLRPVVLVGAYFICFFRSLRTSVEKDKNAPCVSSNAHRVEAHAPLRFLSRSR